MLAFIATLSMTAMIAMSYQHCLQWPDHQNLCPGEKGIGGIPKYPGSLPFAPQTPENEDIIKWFGAQHMCVCNFLNLDSGENRIEHLDWKTIISGDGVTADTKVCFDATPADSTDDNADDCDKMKSQEVEDDFVSIKPYLDIKKQEYDITAVNEYSFTVKGVRYVQLEMKIANFAIGHEFENEFSETYTFNPNGELISREMHTRGELAKQLKDAGADLAFKYFAQVVDSIDSISDPDGNIPIGYGDEYVFYIDRSILLIIIGLFFLSSLVLMTCYCLYKMCCKRRNKKKHVHQYHGIVNDSSISTSSDTDVTNT